MRFLKRYRRSMRLGRDYALVAAALLGLLATTVGVPKIEREHKDHSQSFPCQGGACGCASAEACWRSCCCTTPRQRLAWAAAHNVRPPDELVAEAQKAAREDIASAAPAPTADSASTAASSSAAFSPGKKCCHKHHDRVAGCDSANEGRHNSAAPREHGVRIGWIVGSLASRCRGLQTSSVGAFVALPPPATVSWSFDDCDAGAAPSLLVSFSSTNFPPPAPPPRV